MKFKDQLALNPLFIIAVLFQILVRSTEAAQCKADQISSLNVATCDCQISSPIITKCPLLARQCGSLTAPTDVVPINPYNGGQNLWGQGCIDANLECDGACYVWFGSLCRCLKGSTSCAVTGAVGGRVWALLSKTAPKGLITTSQMLPGILELSQAPEPNRGWLLGQQTLNNPFPVPGVKYTRARGTLAMNSVATRTEEQIHIHVCDNEHSSLREELNKLKRSDYTSLSQVILPNTVPSDSLLYCQVAEYSGKTVDVAARIFEHLNQIHDYEASCKKFYVGAGLITDIHDYTWACVTAGDSRGAEHLFCNI